MAGAGYDWRVGKGPGREAVLRRAVTIPAYVVWFAASVVLTPAALLVLVPIDLAGRRRFALTRAWALVVVYLYAGVAGLAIATWIRLTRGSSPERYLERNFALQCWWGRTLFRAGTRLFGIRVEVEGNEVASTGPFVLLTRHASPIDNLVPSVLVSDRFGIRLRWVINRNLLRDPCLDIVANRLQNAFVHAGSEGSVHDLRKVTSLAKNLGPRDGVAIFPEGALFTPARLAAAIADLREGRDPEIAARAEQLRHVLPPHVGGTVSVLNAAAQADVVFCAHAGLDGAATYRSIAAGAPVGVTLRVRFWRIPAAAIPRGRTERSHWLLEQWQEVDRWVGDALARD